MTSSEVRDKLVEALVLDLIGPIHDPARASERLDQSPSRWYLTGFLVPRARPSMDIPKEEEDDQGDLFGSDDDPVDEPTADTLPIDDSDKAAVVVTSKRQVLPSSMGLSLLVPRACRRSGSDRPLGRLSARVRQSGRRAEPGRRIVRSRGRCRRRQAEETSQESLPGRVQQREQSVTLSLDGPFDRPREQAVPNSDGLRLVWLSRPAPKEALDETLVPDGAQTVNVYLVNKREPAAGAAKDRSAAFQTELTVTCGDGFVPRPSLSGLNSSDDDDRVADLQYAQRLRVRRRPQRLGGRRGRRSQSMPHCADHLGTEGPG